MVLLLYVVRKNQLWQQSLKNKVIQIQVKMVDHIIRVSQAKEKSIPPLEGIL